MILCSCNLEIFIIWGSVLVDQVDVNIWRNFPSNSGLLIYFEVWIKIDFSRDFWMKPKSILTWIFADLFCFTKLTFRNPDRQLTFWIDQHSNVEYFQSSVRIFQGCKRFWWIRFSNLLFWRVVDFVKSKLNRWELRLESRTRGLMSRSTASNFGTSEKLFFFSLFFNFEHCSDFYRVTKQFLKKKD